MKTRKIKAWAVICSKDIGTRAYTGKDKAEAHKKFMNEEYSGHCRHRIVPCVILLPAGKKSGNKKKRI